MLANYARGFDAERPADVKPAPVLDESACRELRGAVDGVKVAPEVREYIANIVRATREDRVAHARRIAARERRALPRGARARRCSPARDFVTPDDVKQFALPVLRHRVMVAPEVEVEGRTQRRCARRAARAGRGAQVKRLRAALAGHRALGRELRSHARLVAIVARVRPLWLASAAAAVVALLAIAIAVAVDLLLLPAPWQSRCSAWCPRTSGSATRSTESIACRSTFARDVRFALHDALPPTTLRPSREARCSGAGRRRDDRARSPSSPGSAARSRWAPAVLRIFGRRELIQRTLRSDPTDEVLVTPSLAGVQHLRLLAVQHRLRDAGIRSIRRRGEGTHLRVPARIRRRRRPATRRLEGDGAAAEADHARVHDRAGPDRHDRRGCRAHDDTARLRRAAFRVRALGRHAARIRRGPGGRPGRTAPVRRRAARLCAARARATRPCDRSARRSSPRARQWPSPTMRPRSARSPRDTASGRSSCSSPMSSTARRRRR